MSEDQSVEMVRILLELDPEVGMSFSSARHRTIVEVHPETVEQWERNRSAFLDDQTEQYQLFAKAGGKDFA